MIKRHIKILEILSAQHSVKVTLLAEMLDVSQVTVRKDLDVLEKRSLICRNHGYACLDGADNAGKNLAHSYSIKQRIAKTAAASVKDGETVMLESGSCCALLAEELAMAQKNVTIVTNSFFIICFVRHLPQIKIILLGGYYQPESQVLVGPVTAKCGEIFHSDKFFMGVDGFLRDFGFTGRDHLRVQTAADLSKHAREVFVLTEAEKFQRHGVVDLISFDKLTGVYTDEGIPVDAEEALFKHRVHLYKVPVHDTENPGWVFN